MKSCAVVAEQCNCLKWKQQGLRPARIAFFQERLHQLKLTTSQALSESWWPAKSWVKADDQPSPEWNLEVKKHHIEKALHFVSSYG